MVKKLDLLDLVTFTKGRTVNVEAGVRICVARHKSCSLGCSLSYIQRCYGQLDEDCFTPFKKLSIVQ